MKRKLLIFSALISLLLAGFQFPILADEDPSDTSSSVPIPNSIRLDQYFFDNYELLPYIESDGNQRINTGIKPSSNLDFDIKYTFISIIDGVNNIFGTSYVGANGYSHYLNNLPIPQYYLLGSYYQVSNKVQIYNYNHTYLDGSNLYFNNKLVSSTVDLSNIDNSNDIFIFSNGSANSSFRLYSFILKNHSDGSFIRYYYPAKSKAGGVIGLYDAVSDTFVTTSGSVPFASPIDDQVLNFQIGSFLTSGLNWIGDILEFAVETPIIMIFMAIGLAGAMFRWGRRLVHF